VLYGDRTDPVRAVSRVGERLGAGLPGVLDAVREALRLPFAALRAGGAEIAASGTAPELLHTLPVIYGADRIGELVVGLRPGEKRLGRGDRAVLELLAAPLSVAVHAVRLSAELQRSREAIVVAREEERRRLRRDLHDGLGPALTGVTFKADAAGNLLAADPAAARDLIAELRGEVAQAVAGIRRLVYDLRPPALDELGLLGAVRQAIDRLARDGTVIRLTAPDALPSLSAAVEAAAYRIAVEALTNAVRHSGAGEVTVAIWADERLHVRVTDDGTARDGAWQGGVGTASMRERAAELGGECTAGPGPLGGLVAAALPLGAVR
jgi:two-component system, NarL family, sensor kinase